jgi:hypothetical protein
MLQWEWDQFKQDRARFDAEVAASRRDRRVVITSGTPGPSGPGGSEDDYEGTQGSWGLRESCARAVTCRRWRWAMPHCGLSKHNLVRKDTEPPPPPNTHTPRGTRSRAWPFLLLLLLL